ncbi:hypothetical protein A35_0013 (plasmid) [Coxiella burnetii 'MSU Goat Q177']|nr:hypothetical protein A35_0013 [Coxiella burnetii 'MSU Goat Q177']
MGALVGKNSRNLVIPRVTNWFIDACLNFFSPVLNSIRSIYFSLLQFGY